MVWSDAGRKRLSRRRQRINPAPPGIRSPRRLIIWAPWARRKSTLEKPWIWPRSLRPFNSFAPARTDFPRTSTNWCPRDICRACPQRHRHLHAVAAELATGDIVLMSGRTRAGALIRAAGGCPYSHVGMVYRPAGADAAGVFIVEATSNRAHIRVRLAVAISVSVCALPDLSCRTRGWGTSSAAG